MGWFLAGAELTRDHNGNFSHPSPGAVSCVPWAGPRAPLGLSRQKRCRWVGVTAPHFRWDFRLRQALQDTCDAFFSSTQPWQSHAVLPSLARVAHCGSRQAQYKPCHPAPSLQRAQAVHSTSANIPVLPWARNSSQQVQTSFLQLGTPAPIKDAAWPGLNKRNAHNAQVLREYLTKYNMCHHSPRLQQLIWYIEFGSPTNPSTIPLFCKKSVCIYAWVNTHSPLFMRDFTASTCSY